MTFEILRYEARHRVRGALGVSAAFSLLGLVFLALAPQIVAGSEVQGLADALPPQFRAAFGLESLTSVEGLLAGEYYTLFWGLFFGIYLAYSAAESVAGDVDAHRMETLLAAPVTRSRVLVEKFLSLLVPVLVASVVVPVVLVAGSWLVEEPVAVADLAALHLLSIPYLLCCGAIGLGCSVAFDRVETARNAAVGTLFGLYLLESLVVGSDVAWLGTLAPMAYFDPNAILVGGTYDLAGALVLLGITAALVLASRVRFERMDIG